MPCRTAIAKSIVQYLHTIHYTQVYRQKSRNACWYLYNSYNYYIVKGILIYQAVILTAITRIAKYNIESSPKKNIRLKQNYLEPLQDYYLLLTLLLVTP